MINVGDKVKVRGSINDFTDHLDGQTLTVYAVPGDDKGYDLSIGDSVICLDSEGDHWYIYIENILEVITDERSM